MKADGQQAGGFNENNNKVADGDGRWNALQRFIESRQKWSRHDFSAHDPTTSKQQTADDPVSPYCYCNCGGRYLPARAFFSYLSQHSPPSPRRRRLLLQAAGRATIASYSPTNSKDVFVALRSLPFFSAFYYSSCAHRLSHRPSRLHLPTHPVCTFPLRLHVALRRLPSTMAYHDDDPGSQLSSELSSLSTSRESSPLSELGRRTPSPPPEIQLSDAIHTMYPKSRALSHVDPSLPTPPPSQENSQSGSPAPDAADSSMLSDKDAPPPAKRRRVGPKERTTRSLDLRHERVDSSEQSQFDDMLRALHKRQKIVVVAGAGISVSAGSA